MLACFFRSVDIVYCFIIGLVNSPDIVFFICEKKNKWELKNQKKVIGLAQFPKSHLISSHLIFAKVILLDLYEVTE